MLCRNIAILLLSVPLLAGGCGKQADFAVVAGKIVTMDSARPNATILLVREGKIWKVGDRRELNSDVENAGRILELEKAVVYPGFIDAHLHVVGTGRSLSELNLVGTRSLDEVLQKVQAKAAGLPEGRWILGRGWDQNDWPIKRFPTRYDLDRVAPHRPVYLRRIDGHAGWANSLALKKAGIGPQTQDVEGGKIYRMSGSAEPSGVLVDNAMSLMSPALPKSTYENVKAYIEAAMQRFTSLGLTCVHDAGVDSLTLAAYKEIIAEGKAKVRVYAMLSPGRAMRRYFATGPEIDYGGGLLTVRAVKLFADGALGSRGAALFEPYSDDAENRGLIVTSAEEIERITIESLRAGFQVCTHAIGDRANHLVLDAYEKALSAVPTMDHRLRIEHAQVLVPDDILRFGEMGVVASMQPTHATSDMPWAEDRLGPQRVRGAYAWRSVLDHGARIAGGSDSPVESANPLLGIYAAVTRQDLSGNPPGGWQPKQRVTLEEALRMFTVDAAYAGFAEKSLGSLTPGKWADFVALSHDLSSIRPSEIPSVEVKITAVGGKIIYERKN